MEYVNHPEHYKLKNNKEVIDVLAETLTAEELRGFVLGNAIKYITRSAVS